MTKHLFVAYFTGAAGSSLGMFCMGDGIIVGADVGGLTYDGIMEKRPDGSYEGMVEFSVPPGTQLVTGLVADKQQSITAPIKLSSTFDDGATVTLIETAAGPVNARFERVKELPQ